MDLEALVTGALAQEETSEEVLSLQELSQTSIDALSVLEKGRIAERDLLETSDREEVRRIVAPLAVRYLGVSMFGIRTATRHGAGISLMLQLLDFLETGEGLDEIRAFVRQTNNRIELSQILGTDDRKMAYLEELWGDETPEAISKMTGTSLATVRKWFAGANPSSSNSSRIGNIASVIFQMRVECGLSPEETRAALLQSRETLGGKSCADSLAETRYHWTIPAGIGTVLREMGSTF